MNKENRLVILEPGLEEQAVGLNATQCRKLAGVYERWAHQLRVKAKILDRVHGPRAKPQLPKLSRAKTLLN